MKVQVKDGVKDIEPYTPDGDVFDFSGFTGTCRKTEFYDDEDVVLVSFDKRSISLLPQEYIDHAGEVDTDYSCYYFYKTDLSIVEGASRKQKTTSPSFTRIDMDIMRSITHQEDAIRKLQGLDVSHPQVSLAIRKLENSRGWLMKFLEGPDDQELRYKNLMKEEPDVFDFDPDFEIEDCIKEISEQMRQDHDDLDVNNRSYSCRLMNLLIELGNIHNRLEDVISGYDS